MLRAGLSPREWDVLHYLCLYQDAHSWMPTVRDICEGVGISSTSLVVYYLEKLERKGLLYWEEHGARAIRFTERGREALGLLEEQRP